MRSWGLGLKNLTLLCSKRNEEKLLLESKRSRTCRICPNLAGNTVGPIFRIYPQFSHLSSSPRLLPSWSKPLFLVWIILKAASLVSLLLSLPSSLFSKMKAATGILLKPILDHFTLQMASISLTANQVLTWPAGRNVCYL